MEQTIKQLAESFDKEEWEVEAVVNKLMKPPLPLPDITEIKVLQVKNRSTSKRRYNRRKKWQTN